MSPKEQIEFKEGQVRYKKVGRKYVPVDTEFDTYGLKEGWYLVKIGSGCTSYRHNVDPDNAAIECAVADGVDNIIDVLREAQKARPANKITPEQRADWDALNEKHPDMFDYVQWNSLNDMAENIIKGLLGKPQDSGRYYNSHE